jgi:hypothetical protein
MVKFEYCINALGNCGGEVLLRKGIENKDEAQQVLAQIVKHVSARKTRYVSLGDIVFDPSYIMAYVIEEHRVWEESDRVSTCDCPGDGDIVTVIDMDGAETTETVEDAPQEGVEEALF